MSETFTLEEIASQIGASLVGDGTCPIHSLAPLDKARPGQLAFLSNPKFLPELAQTSASAVILTREAQAGFSGNCLVMEDPYLGFARASRLFDSAPRPAAGMHASAIVHGSAQIGAGVSIGAGCVIEADAIVEDGVVIDAGTVIGGGCRIGANTRLYSNVTLYHDVVLGERCILHSGCVIGSDGFGFANKSGSWVKIAQLGGVRIGDDVEIGASTTIDRGALEDTVIGNGVKLDNQIHIAHNVEIGEHTAMAGCSAVAGSTKIGAYCTFSGRTNILGHLEICDRVHITATTLVNRSITSPGTWSSGTLMQPTAEWRKSAARFRKLDEMWRRLKSLEKALLKKRSESDNDN